MATAPRRSLALTLVLLLTIGTMVALATPAAACSCEVVDVTREEVLERGGAVEGTVVGISEPYELQLEEITEYVVVDVEVAVARAFGADPGPRLTLPAEPLSVDLGDGTSVSSSCGIDLQPGSSVAFFLDERVLGTCSLVPGGFDDSLADPVPPPGDGAIRFLGRPIDEGNSVAGYTVDGQYVSQVALPSAGPLVRCPGEETAIVQHGGGVYTGVEDISWSRLDLTTLAVEELIDITTLNPDPVQLQNVHSATVCLAPDASDVLALFSWWEPPDEKPQRLVRIADGVVTELAVAPIWGLWAHDGTVYARVGGTGTDIVTVDPATGALTPHGTLPSGGSMPVAADGSWGLLADRSDPAGPRTVDRVQLVPEVAVTATTTVADRIVRPLTDGRTLVIVPSQTTGPVLEVLDEALAPEGAATLPGERWGVAELAQDPAGVWLADTDGRLTRWDRGADPVTTDIAAEVVLPVDVVPAEPFPATQIELITYDQPATDAPAVSSESAAAPPPAAGPARAQRGSLLPEGVSWPAVAAVVLGFAFMGGLVVSARRSGD